MLSNNGSPEKSSRSELGMAFWDCACPSGRTYLSRSFWSSERLFMSASNSFRSSAESGTEPFDHRLPPGSPWRDAGFPALVQFQDFGGSVFAFASFFSSEPFFSRSFPNQADFDSPFAEESEFSGCFSSFFSPSFEPHLSDSSAFLLSQPLSWSCFSFCWEFSLSAFTCSSRSFFTISKLVRESSFPSIRYDPVYATSAPYSQSFLLVHSRVRASFARAFHKASKRNASSFSRSFPSAAFASACSVETASRSKFEFVREAPSAMRSRSLMGESFFEDSSPVSNMRVAVSYCQSFSAAQPIRKNASGLCEARLTAKSALSAIMKPVRSAFWIMRGFYQEWRRPQRMREGK